jgi:chemotaxis response regulator CheB
MLARMLAPSAQGAPVSRRQLRMVVVDDSSTVLRALCRFLGTIPDLQVAATGSNGFDALRLVRRFQPDLVLMDIQMPGMNGISAMRRIRKAFPGLVVILMSSYELGLDVDPELLKDCTFIPKSDLAGKLCPELKQRFPGWLPTL